MNGVVAKAAATRAASPLESLGTTMKSLECAKTLDAIGHRGAQK